MYKGKLLGKWISSYYRIPYGIIIPDPKKKDGEKLGDIVQGYCKPNLLIRMFCPKLFRPRYYRYFDSWDCPSLPDLPEDVRPYGIETAAREPEAARGRIHQLIQKMYHKNPVPEISQDNQKEE